jgi:signal peptidase
MRDQTAVAPPDVMGRVRLVVPMAGAAAMHPQTVVVFAGGIVVLVLASTGSSARARAIQRRQWIRWATPYRRRSKAPAIAGFTLAAATCGMTGIYLSTTLSQAVFASATNDGTNSFAAADGYYSTVLSMNPQSYWRFGEASGTTSTDVMGGLNGTYNGATLGAAGALSHDNNTSANCVSGATCWSTTDNAAYHNTGAQTIAMWLKPGVSAQAQFARVFTKYDGTNLTYFMAYDNSGAGSAGVKMRYMMDTTSKRVQANSTTSITNTSQWYFVVGTFDGTTAQIYVNGSAEGSDTGSGVVKQNNVGFAALANVGGTAGAKGTLDDVAIWTRALTPTEIATLYTRGTT